MLQIYSVYGQDLKHGIWFQQNEQIKEAKVQLGLEGAGWPQSKERGQV